MSRHVICMQTRVQFVYQCNLRAICVQTCEPVRGSCARLHADGGALSWVFADGDLIHLEASAPVLASWTDACERVGVRVERGYAPFDRPLRGLRGAARSGGASGQPKQPADDQAD